LYKWSLISRKLIEKAMDKQAIPVHFIQLQETSVHSLATVGKVYEKSGIAPRKDVPGMFMFIGLKIVKLTLTMNKVFVASDDRTG
jgi:hypothetical protein